MTKKNIMRSMLAMLLVAIVSVTTYTQSTTSEITGRIVDGQGQPLAGVAVEATHVPSGTVYDTVTNDSGRYAIPNMRVGGPYTVKVSFVGFKDQARENLQLSLGTAATVDFTMSTAISEEVTVTSDAIFSEARTGAATSISNEVVQTLPTINRQIGDFTKLTPQAGGGGTFAGQDNRLNNITVDGSYFNNSFGLAGQPGERTGVSPISLDAIEEFQVNVAPYDVRQGNFVGAAVNTVTRSGTNEYNGSIYYLWRKPGLVGKKAGTNTFNPGAFDFKNWGFRFGGPMAFPHFGEHKKPNFYTAKNKLFFFVSYESEDLTEPGTTFTARAPGQASAGNVTRVLASDLNNLSAFLAQNFGYQTGPYQGYSHQTPARKWLIRGDQNINSNNHLSVRYIRLRSQTDVLASNSSSLGFGSRRSNRNALNFQNSNYIIMENIDSLVGEWTSMWGTRLANSLIVGYTKQDESRASRGTFFPLVDILEGSSVYTTFGFEPFTPNNELRYKSFQVQDNVTYYRGSHTFNTGFSFEKYESENVFFPGSQSVYVYRSLNDFYTDANGYLANPNRTTSPINLRRFQVRWSNIPNLAKPLQPLRVKYMGGYIQDNWKLRDNFSLTFGVRADVPFFAATGFTNPQANAMSFMDENGQSVQFRTEKLPDANILWSPRVGFNWTPLGSGRVQVRGGTGVFTGRPAYVWISNQIGGNGILTGFEQLDNVTSRPFDPNPNRYKPATVTGAPAPSYDLALTQPNFRFPQIWRSSAAVDVRLPFFGLIAGAEFMHSKDVNGIYYINANLPAPDSAFTGPDTRPRWVADRCPTIAFTQATRINCVVTTAIVLKNQNVGKTWNFAATLERPFRNGLYIKGAWSYGEAKNTVDPGSIASGSWFNNPHAGNPNNPGLGFSGASPGHRVFATFSYHRDYFKFGGTTVSMFWETRNSGNGSYRFGGDLNGDGGFSNDLIYIPANVSEMNFGNITNSSGSTVLVSAADQATAFEAFIQQDPYLSKNRGKYAVRGAAFLPFTSRADLSVAQDLFFKLGGTTQKFQLRADILNFSNMLNSNWGVGTSFNSLQPLIPTSTSSSATCRQVTPSTAATYCLRQINGALLKGSYVPTLGTGDVWRLQLGVRYIFNK